MPEFITFKKHSTTNSYLRLNDMEYKEITLNLNHIVSFSYNENYSNGYGETLSYLCIKTVNGDFELYRQDADDVYRLIKQVGANKNGNSN